MYNRSETTRCILAVAWELQMSVTYHNVNMAPERIALVTSQC